MRVLLLRAPLKDRITADMSDVFEEDAGVYPPLGLLYLHAALRDARPSDEVTVLDSLVEGLDMDGVLRHATALKPDVIGITVLTFHLVDVYKCVAALKKHLPGTKLVLGGPHVHLFPRETLLNRDVDYVLTGEGERSFPLLLDAVEKGGDVARVPGIFYRDPSGSVREGERACLIKDLDGLPPVDYTAVPLSLYKPFMEREQSAILMSSRGCPYHCVYCDRPHLGSVFRPHSPRRVLDDIKSARRQGVKSFQFFDDTFTVIRPRVLEICRLIREECPGITFALRARVNTVDEELLAALKNSGCSRISFGVEAGSDRMLASLRKNITTAQVRRAFALCGKTGIDTLADFIIGGPDQTADDIRETIAFALELEPSYAQFTIMTPYPGTELYRMGMERGIIRNDYWREFAESPTEDFETPVWEEHVTKERLLEFFRRAYKKFYRRPRYILRELTRIRSLEEFSRKARVGIKALMPGAEKNK